RMFRRKRSRNDFSDEVKSHIDAETEQLRDEGATDADAKIAARRSFGNVTRAKERHYESRRVIWRNNLWLDLRFAARMLRKAPGFAAVAILTLALGIGANTAIFSVVYAGLIRSLPYAQPKTLVALSEERDQQSEGSEGSRVSYPDLLDWRAQTKAFRSIAGYTGDSFILRGAGEPQLIQAAQVTANFFGTLGVAPIMGRDFAAGEEIASGPKVALISFGFWHTRFNGDPQAVGKTIQLDSNTVDVIGVLPMDFHFGPVRNAGVWVPLHVPQELVTRRNLRWIAAVGRIAPGMSFSQARADMDAMTAALAKAYPQEDGSVHAVMQSLRDLLVGKVEPLLLILFGAVGFVLLVACANVASLLLVRGAGRQREYAIRAALGASRVRLISLSMAESLMLAAAGAGIGFAAAQWATRLLIAAIPKPLLDSVPVLENTRPNAAVFAFLCAIAALTGILFGLAPALQSAKQRATDALKEESRGTAGKIRTRLRDALVAGEIAFCLVLLVGAGLMVKSFGALLHRNPGFATENLLTFDVNLPDASYPKPEDELRFDAAFRERARALPGVKDIANTSVVPLTGNANTIRFVVEGQPVRVGGESESLIVDVTNGYFSAMKISLLAGRFFDDADDTQAGDRHVIVSQAWVKQYLRGESPLGKRIRFTYSPKQKFREIVGVVGDIANSQLDSPELPAIYLPFTQDPNTYISYVVRTQGNPANALSGIREALRESDSQLFLIQPTTMEQVIDRSPAVFLRRYPSYLIGSFAALAMVLAMIGLYGLISYSVSQRTREFGIRIAVGAARGDILGLVLKQGVKLAAIGVGAGIIAALALTQLMTSLLFGVRSFDPETFLLMSVGLAAVALAACYIPARRAVRVDPISALRHE
ncbi:MAG TPA: ABC transporter permease, partial [Candidatus Acidoferrales bacterium]|nr:ABC transporter permease [Candidatus Acidoferrales bacterium]